MSEASRGLSHVGRAALPRQRGPRPRVALIYGRNLNSTSNTCQDNTERGDGTDIFAASVSEGEWMSLSLCSSGV
eukprot:scaffold65939_cov26-Tisochrysis_lutea.AAC.1